MSVLDEHGLGARIDRALRMARHAVEELEAISVELAPALDECPSCSGEGVIGGLLIGGAVLDEACRRCRGRGRVAVDECHCGLFFCMICSQRDLDAEYETTKRAVG